MAIRSLCDCIVEYKYKYNGQTCVLRAHQEEAQPMGKILSFTVLCLINLSVCRKAVELDQSSPEKNIKIKVKDFPGLINGDDCCFPMKDINIWSHCSSIVGLNNSIGKTFYSDKFVEMNSRTFLLKRNDINNSNQFSEIPFINFGLMKGLVRSSIGEATNTELGICQAISRLGCCHRELTKGLSEFHHDLDYLFKGYNNKYLLSDEIKGIPYYIPEWLGGLGLNPGLEPHLYISELELQAAKFIFNHYDSNKPQKITDSKTCLIDYLVDKRQKRIFKDLDVEKSIPPYQTIWDEGQEFSLSDGNTRAYNLLVEEVWRTEKFDDFFRQVDDNLLKVNFKICSRKLAKNRKLWGHAKAVQEFFPCRPLKWHKLWHIKQKDVLPLVVASPKVQNLIRNRSCVLGAVDDS